MHRLTGNKGAAHETRRPDLRRSPPMRAECRPISNADVPQVARYFHRTSGWRYSLEELTERFRQRWDDDAPNNGFLLHAGGEVVGALGAAYSYRTIRGVRERFCSTHSWRVEHDHRGSSLTLLKFVFRQNGYHFTVVQPNAVTVAVLQRLGFKFAERVCFVVPNVARNDRDTRILRQPEDVERALKGQDLTIFHDHRCCKRVRQIAVSCRDGICHVIYRRELRKNIPMGSIIHASRPDILSRAWGTIASHMLFRHAFPLTLIEARLIARRPPAAFEFRNRIVRMYRSPSLRARDVDNLYSELVL